MPSLKMILTSTFKHKNDFIFSLIDETFYNSSLYYGVEKLVC